MKLIRSLLLLSVLAGTQSACANPLMAMVEAEYARRSLLGVGMAVAGTLSVYGLYKLYCYVTTPEKKVDTVRRAIVNELFEKNKQLLCKGSPNKEEEKKFAAIFQGLSPAEVDYLCQLMNDYSTAMNLGTVK